MHAGGAQRVGKCRRADQLERRVHALGHDLPHHVGDLAGVEDRVVDALLIEPRA